MSNPMDNIPFKNAVQPTQNDIMTVIQKAQQNPALFEEQIRQTNPQAYQQACQIRNSANPREAILQLAQSRGMNPNILKMFGII